ncbi:MAG: hypothetical protein KA248_06205 [Kiritimatiellae bacterium]|nr:hypothetical protein [Kiritimatiellia bacterium]
MKTTWFRMIGVIVTAGALACLSACEDSDDDKGSSSGTAAGTSSGGSSGGSGSQTSQGSSSQGNSQQNSSSQSTPKEEPPALAKSELVGTWQAARESKGADEVQYTFTLQADGSAVYATTTYMQLTNLLTGETTDGAVQSHTTGSWDLGGLTLILVSPTPEMDGQGEVQNKNRVVINGRTFTKP